jgi:hypothetical protein
LTKAIITWDATDFDAKLKSLSLDAETSHYLVGKLIHDLLRGCASSSSKQQGIALAMLHKLLVVLDDKAAIVQLIVKNAASSDSRYRVLAISLMRLVTDASRLRSPIYSLALDRVPAVRSALVKSLPDIPIAPSMAESLARTAAFDSSDCVRCAAAKAIPAVASHFVAEFNSLLRSPAAAKTALEGLPAMAAANSFAAFCESFAVAIELEPDSAASALVKCGRTLRDGQHMSALLFAEQLGSNRNFLNGLFEFSGHFRDRRQFLQFIDVKKASKWRDRMVILRQTILFVPLFARDVVGPAMQFADDEAAIVRDSSVVLWVRIIAQYGNAVADLAKLLEKKWQTRLVVAKVVRQLGVRPELHEIAERISKDEVANVRTCLIRETALRPSPDRRLGQDGDWDIAGG